jgi:hypothetical protein
MIISRYGVYGIRLTSDTALDLPPSRGVPLADVEIRSGTRDFFDQAILGVPLERRADWCWLARLPDQGVYVRWIGVGEYLVSADGHKIVWLRASDAPVESFQVYLLGQALSFALLKLSFEPLHGTAVVVAGGAIAILGDSGFGKSTLAAQFLASGASLLTDDLLLLRSMPEGVLAYPGPSRLKLFPNIAERFFPSASEGPPMNPLTEKQILPMENRHLDPVLLRAIYVLSAPEDMSQASEIRIERLSDRQAFLALGANTFNLLLTDPERLQRQFQDAARWVEKVPIRSLSYPRSLARLPDVQRAVVEDAIGGA